MAVPKGKTWEDRVRLFIKAEIKRADVTYEDLAKRLEKHGFKESAASIANKLSRGTFSATFLMATIAALELEGIQLADL
jgi:virulence-associated protein VapD